MGIKDIPLSTTTQPLSIPKPPELETILHINNKGPLGNDPQSGSILKILAENGFKEKIQEGFSKGHTYTILHAAPSSDFTLIDTWTENALDDAGNTISKPRKAYQFFKIKTEEIIVQPKELEPPTLPLLSEGDRGGVVTTTEIKDTPQPPLKEGAPAPAQVVAEIPAIPPLETAQVNRAEEIANKIKKGGATMTAEDWQYRNENWPAIEKYLEPSAATPSKTMPTADTPQSLDIVVTAQPDKASQSSEPTSLTAQHYDSKAWLMKKLGATQPAPIIQTPPAHAEQSISSYDLLKKKFARPTVSQADSAETTPAQVVQTAEERKNNFIASIFETAINEWDAAKNIPARAFIYPTEYGWGTGPTGEPIDRSLEDYPPRARKLREKIAQSIEDISLQGIDIETTKLDQAITEIFNKNIL